MDPSLKFGFSCATQVFFGQHRMASAAKMDRMAVLESGAFNQRLHRCRKDELGTSMLVDVKELPLLAVLEVLRVSVRRHAHIWSIRHQVHDHVNQRLGRHTFCRTPVPSCTTNGRNQRRDGRAQCVPCGWMEQNVAATADYGDTIEHCDGLEACSTPQRR